MLRHVSADKKVSEYDQDIPQLQTNKRHHEEELQDINSNKTIKRQ